jgi:hypothetical protein
MGFHVNTLYLLPLKVLQAARHLPNPGEMPWIDCFVAAPDSITASSEAVHKICDGGYLIVDCRKVQEIDPKSWSTFVASRYPGATDQLPSEAEIHALLETGGVFWRTPSEPE